jgi:hypothetical protein
MHCLLFHAGIKFLYMKHIKHGSFPFFFFYYYATALVGQGLNVQDPQTLSDTPHSVGLLRTSDQPNAETSN